MKLEIRFIYSMLYCNMNVIVYVCVCTANLFVVGQTKIALDILHNRHGTVQEECSGMCK